jgi:hypothetical protein
VNAGVDLKYSFGASACKRGHVHYVDLKTVVYQVGNHLAFHNTEDNEITYLKRHKDARTVMSMAVSPSLKYLAAVRLLLLFFFFFFFLVVSCTLVPSHKWVD